MHELKFLNIPVCAYNLYNEFGELNYRVPAKYFFK
jgi:hypothetical protein